MKSSMLCWIVAVSAAIAALRRVALPLLLGGASVVAQAQSTPATTSPSACPARLRVAFPDSPAEPFLRGQGDDFAAPPGLLVDWLRASLRHLGCLDRAEFVRLPARRVRAMIEAGQADLVAGVADGGPLAALLALPPHEGRKRDFDLSLAQVEFSFYARRGSGFVWDGQHLPPLPPDGRIGVTSGSRADAIAQERSWPQEPAPNHESALQKLLAGRTSLLLVHGYYLDERLRLDADLARHVVKLTPAVDRLRLHVGASQALARAEPAFMNRLWHELCRQSAAAKADGACRLPPG